MSRSSVPPAVIGNHRPVGAGALLLTETARITGLAAGLSAGLERWRPSRAVHDQGKTATRLILSASGSLRAQVLPHWAGPLLPLARLLGGPVATSARSPGTARAQETACWKHSPRPPAGRLGARL